jgi:hypothetical protein
LSGTTGPNQALVQIDENEGGGSSFPYYTVAGLGGYVNTEINYFPIYVTRIYFKQKGSYVFRMEGHAEFGPPALVQSWDHVFTAIYYPTSYDKVLTLTSDPSGFSGAVPIQMLDSSGRDRSGLYYQVDLRELEQKSVRDSAESNE